MAIPSGAGTEVLKRHTSIGSTNNFNAATALLTVTTNHIYIILTIIICETGSASEGLYLSITDADVSNQEIYLIRGTTAGLGALTSLQTFIWDDKFVLDSADTLRFQTDNPSNLDIHISYIDQDWT
jgi:hypothetical protein